MRLLPHILILGGGFAGRAAMLALRGALHRGLCRVSLVDRLPHTVMVPALPDYAAGRLSACALTTPFEGRLPDGIEHRRETVEAVDLPRRRVQTGKGSLSYDFLVLAWGAVSCAPAEANSPAAGFTADTWDKAARLRRAYPAYLRRAGNRAQVVISGAGYTGIELAVALRARAAQECPSCRILILERGDTLLPFLDKAQRRRVLRSLRRQRIDHRTSCHIDHTDGIRLTLSDGQVLENVFLCRSEGTRAPLLPAGESLHARPDGRLPVSPDLTLPAWPGVYAAGNAAAIPDPKNPSTCLRKSVYFAMTSGACAGGNVARRLHGRPPRTFRARDPGWVLPLGDDSVGRLAGHVPLQGRTGLSLHYLLCGWRHADRRRMIIYARFAWNLLTGKEIE